MRAGRIVLWVVVAVVVAAAVYAITGQRVTAVFDDGVQCIPASVQDC